MIPVRNSQIISTITLLITIFSLSFPAYAKYSGGTGEPNDPYQIATAEDLMLLGETLDDYDKHFILTADIDLDPNLPGRKVFDKAVIAPDINDANWGFDGLPFRGSFDGNGYVISHLTINGKQYLGLFGKTGSGASISNLGLEEVDVNGTGDYVGGLVGMNTDSSSITNCYSIVTVVGEDIVGGLVGHNRGDDSSITNSYSTGLITGSTYVGGLIGWNDDGDITACYSSGTVSGEIGVGGLVGFNEGNATNTASYSTCMVTGSSNVGGLVGMNEYCSTITASYSTGSISGNNYVGGLVGWNDGSISNSYSSGSVKGNDEVGGLVGYTHYLDRISLTSLSFWDTETSGQATSAGGSGLTTAEMWTASTFLNAGWDFVGETINGPNDVWKIVEGLTYPLLSWQKYGGGTGEPNDPYLIYTAEHLNDLGTELNDYDKHFKLMADIDLSGYLYDRAIIAPDTNNMEGGFQGTPFTGVFDGDDHRIMNLNINYNKWPGVDYLGLYGCIGEDGRVSNLGLEGGSVRGPSQEKGSRWVGGLAGQNYGRVSYCYYTGVVVGWDTTGGLVGENEGCITMSYSTASVSGWEWIGGLVGANGGSIANCYSNGTVTGSITAGLAGYNGGDGSITNCYTTAAYCLVNEYNGGSITSSFFEYENCDFYNPSEPRGLCLTTAEMQTAATFLEAGWDFVDETANGTEDIWWIDEGNDYPRLWWELGDEA